jgi:hypothetical protein
MELSIQSYRLYVPPNFSEIVEKIAQDVAINFSKQLEGYYSRLIFFNTDQKRNR